MKLLSAGKQFANNFHCGSLAMKFSPGSEQSFWDWHFSLQVCTDVCKERLWHLLQGSRAGRGTAQHAELAQQDGNDSVFDPSVVAILEEAITLGILPSFR